MAAFALAAVAAALFVRLVRGGGGEADEVGPETALVRRGRLPVVIETTGQIQAGKSIAVDPPEQHGLQITWVIEEGAEVEKGEVLLKFDDKYQKERLQRAEIELENYRQRVTRAEEAIKIEEAEIEKKLADAALQVELARLEVEKYGEVLLDENGKLDDDAYSSPGAPSRGEAYQKFRDAELAITKAQTDRRRAIDDFEGMDGLLEKGFVTLSDFTDAQLAVTEAERRVESALLSYDILRRYTYPMELSRRKHALEKARNSLAQAKIEARSRRLKAETELRTAKLVFDRYRREVDEATGALENLEVCAPIDGMVLYGDPSKPWMRRYISVGQQIWHGIRLFTFPDLSTMVVESRVLEMDYYKLALSQKVTVKVDALPDLVLTGEISNISETASRGRYGSDWTYFAFKANINQRDQRLKPGMSCDIEIVTDCIDDALYVPVGAVFTAGGRRICHVVEGDSTVRVEVEVGKSSEEFAQILEGLEEGQRVLLAEGKREGE